MSAGFIPTTSVDQALKVLAALPAALFMLIKNATQGLGTNWKGSWEWLWHHALPTESVSDLANRAVVVACKGDTKIWTSFERCELINGRLMLWSNGDCAPCPTDADSVRVWDPVRKCVWTWNNGEWSTEVWVGSIVPSDWDNGTPLCSSRGWCGNR